MPGAPPPTLCSACGWPPLSATAPSRSSRRMEPSTSCAQFRHAGCACLGSRSASGEAASLCCGVASGQHSQPTDVLLARAPPPCRSYRLSQNIKPLIWVECIVEKHSRSRTEYLVKARSQFKERSTATSVEILLPLPPDAISPTVRTSQVHTVHGAVGAGHGAGCGGREAAPRASCRACVCCPCGRSCTQRVPFRFPAGHSGVRAREGGAGVEDQELPRGAGVPAALQVWAALGGGGGGGAGAAAAHQGQVRGEAAGVVARVAVPPGWWQGLLGSHAARARQSNVLSLEVAACCPCSQLRRQAPTRTCAG